MGIPASEVSNTLYWYRYQNGVLYYEPYVEEKWKD